MPRQKKVEPESTVKGATTWEQVAHPQPEPEPQYEPDPIAVSDTHRGTQPINIGKEIDISLVASLFEINGDTQFYEVPGVPYTPEVVSLSMPHITLTPFLRYRAGRVYGLLAYDVEKNAVFTLGGFLHVVTKLGELYKA